jgi:hypothetical protein
VNNREERSSLLLRKKIVREKRKRRNGMGSDCSVTVLLTEERKERGMRRGIYAVVVQEKRLGGARRTRERGGT